MPVSSRIIVSAVVGALVAALALWVVPTVAERGDSGTSAPTAGLDLPSADAQGLVFHRTSPCRIVDTRAATGSNRRKLAPGDSRTYQVGGTTGFPAQGGKSAGCQIPVTATAVSASISAVNPSGAGYLRAWPSDEAEPTATAMNYAKAESETVGTTLAVAATTGPGLTVKNYAGTIDLVIDVNGYYVDQIQTAIAADGTMTSGTRSVLATSRIGKGVYRVTIAHPLDGCAVQVQAADVERYTSVGPVTGSSVDLYVWQQPGDGSNRPGDSRLQVTITC